MSRDELELLLLLSPGDAIEARDRRNRKRWQGTVDITAPGLGKLWMFAELGERKLIDTESHIVSKPDHCPSPTSQLEPHPNLIPAVCLTEYPLSEDM
jgi:hypothetical protein